MNLPMRNSPPEHGIRVPFEDLRRYVGELFTRAGMYRHDADLLADILTRTDQRCVYSHGTRQAVGYIQRIRDGEVNPRAKVTVIEESSTTVTLDGDGGMGYFPCYRGTEMAIEKAKKHGVGVATSCNHFHFGAAGVYSRMALPHDCIGLAISSHRYPLDPDKSILNASGGSPMSIAIPAQTQPPFVLDMSAGIMPGADREALFEQYASAYIKSLGLGIMFQVLGGILAGIRKPEFQPPVSKWTSNQGAFVVVFNVVNLRPVDEFKREMDDFIRQARDMKPMPGMSRAELPGGMEWQWEKENERDGIPIRDDHREILERIGNELNVPSPFHHFEKTRF